VNVIIFGRKKEGEGNMSPFEEYGKLAVWEEKKRAR